MDVAAVAERIVSLGSLSIGAVENLLPAVKQLIAETEVQTKEYAGDAKGRHAASMAYMDAGAKDTSLLNKSIYRALWDFAAVQGITRMDVHQLGVVLALQTPLPNAPKVDSAHDETIGGGYVPQIRALFMPQRLDGSKSGISGLAHELSHAASIDMGIAMPDSDPLAYSFNEVLAETSSYFLMSHFGIDNTEQTARYIDLYGPPSSHGNKWEFSSFCKAVTAGAQVACQMIEALTGQ